MRWFNVVIRLIFRGLLKVFADWHVYERENLPWGEPFLVISNHQSNLDPPLISVSLGRPVKYLAKADLFRNPLSGYFFRHYGAFPINRDGRDLAASKWALEQLKAGDDAQDAKIFNLNNCPDLAFECHQKILDIYLSKISKK